MTASDTSAGRGSFVGTAAVFLFGGPLLLDVAISTAWALGLVKGGGLLQPSNLGQALLVYGFLILLVGWPAMLVCGLGLPLVSPRLKSRGAWIAASLAACGLLPLATALVVGGGGDFRDILRNAGWFLLMGGGTGLVCALITERFRPRA